MPTPQNRVSDESNTTRISLTTSAENKDLPSDARRERVSADLRQAIDDARNRVNLNGPYQTVQGAVDAMLEDATN
ncbi:MAG: hypothetical protein IJL92_04310 [Thermoguttaceae bacterium]|nr:hypothetical protein [Thermoguttaceae bacterium]